MQSEVIPKWDNVSDVTITHNPRVSFWLPLILLGHLACGPFAGADTQAGLIAGEKTVVRPEDIRRLGFLARLTPEKRDSFVRRLAGLLTTMAAEVAAT